MVSLCTADSTAPKFSVFDGIKTLFRQSNMGLVLWVGVCGQNSAITTLTQTPPLVLHGKPLAMSRAPPAVCGPCAWGALGCRTSQAQTQRSWGARLYTRQVGQATATAPSHAAPPLATACNISSRLRPPALHLVLPKPPPRSAHPPPPRWPPPAPWVFNEREPRF